MAVVSVLETFSGVTGDQADGNLRMTRVYFVQLSARRDSPNVALTADDGSQAVPAMYAAHPDDATCTMRKKGAKRQSNPLWWEVTCEYSNEPKPQSQPKDDQNQSPPDRTPKVTRGSVRQKRVFERDYSVTEDSDEGEPVVNSAGEKFDPPLEREVVIPTVTVTRFEAAFDDAFQTSYMDHVNDAPWNGKPANSVLLADVRAVDHYEGDIRYFEVSYEFHLDTTDLWVAQILDQGYTQIVAGPGFGRRVLIRDAKDGTPLSKPSLLDGEGHKLATGGTPVFLPFQRYRTADFSTLNLNGLF